MQENHSDDLVKRNVNIYSVGIILISILTSCNTKSKEDVKPTQFFTINDSELISDNYAIPDSLDKNVYQAEVNQTVRLQGPPAISPDQNLWFIDGNEIAKGKSQFVHIFDLPGLYQIRHCHGLYNCATRFVYVRHPVAEEIPLIEEEVPSSQSVYHTLVKEPKKPRNEPRVINSELVAPPSSPHTEKPVEKPTEKPAVKPVGKPPESFKNSAITGFSSGSYKTECAKWQETANIKLKPKEFCLLHTAVIYCSSVGKVRINLSDGVGYNESMSIVVSEGRTQFAFADLIPVLYPDRVYSLTISGVAGTDGVKPKIANISSCNESPKTTPALGVEYGANSVLFDINFKVK